MRVAVMGYVRKTKGWIYPVFLFLLYFSTSSAWCWTIQDFTTEIIISKDSTLTIGEKITVDFQSEFHHGIYREIPVKYKRGATNYNLRLKVISVEDERGGAYPHKVTRKGRYTGVRIGDPDRYVQGINTYNILYQIQRGINYFDDHDELYWNVTGDEWNVPIQRAKAVISFPQEIPRKELSWRSFTGPRGSTTSKAGFYWEDGHLIASLEDLRPREGLTVVLSLPKGYLTKPRPFLKTLWFIQDNGFFAIPVVVFIIMFLLWFTRGRNPRVPRSIMVRYHPPSQLTPSEAGTIIDERADLADITAMVVDLAVRGYIKIKQIVSTKLLFLSQRDYIFTLLKEDYLNESDLKKHERSFLRGIFEAGKKEVTLSSLKNKFYIHLPPIRDSIYRELTGNGYFSGRPDKIRKSYLSFGLVLVVGGLFLALFFNRVDLLVSLPMSGAIIIAFSFVMPRLTTAGVDMLYQILGLKEFIKRAEKDRLKRLSQEDPAVFDRVLPYAMVMGVADEWAEGFQDLYREPPTWYESSTWPATRFYTALLVADLGEGLRTMGDTFSSSPPRTSAASGGSGFGGGFSGGGFGGGGGGTW